MRKLIGMVLAMGIVLMAASAEAKCPGGVCPLRRDGGNASASIDVGAMWGGTETVVQEYQVLPPAPTLTAPTPVPANACAPVCAVPEPACAPVASVAAPIPAVEYRFRPVSKQVRRAPEYGVTASAAFGGCSGWSCGGAFASRW